MSELPAPGASAGRLARPVTRLGRRFAVRGDDKGLLQGHGAAVHEARANDRMLRQLGGQGFQKRVTLLGMNRRGGSLNGSILVVG
jgi:hypothetical protein